MRKKLYWAIFLIIALAGLSYYFLAAAAEVEMTTVTRGDILHTVVDTGYVQAVDKTDVYATQGGRVMSLPVNVGQKVEKDQVIMVLENRDLAMSTQQLQVQLNQANASVSSTQAALEQTRIDLDKLNLDCQRAQELYSAGALSQVEYENARSLLDKTQASFDALSQTLADGRQQVASYQGLIANSRQNEQALQIKSPIAGTIMQLPVHQQDVVSYGSLLAQVGSAGLLEIKVDLLSDDLGDIKLGQKAQITAPVLGEQALTGEIVKIYPQAEEKQSALGVIQRRVPTIVRLNQMGNLKPGYETRVTIITAGKEGVLLVPREAVITAADGQKQVMQIVNSRIRLVVVKTGLQDSKNVEIIEGLLQGDQIVKDASVSLQPNARVKVKQ
ncbi:MAG: efflux RND transporter periplasmic adaptor subunit [Syntrophomonadaceae bacterium]